MRTGRRVAAVAQLLLDRSGALQRVGHALERQFAAYFFGPQPAAIVQIGNGRHQWRGRDVKTVAQDMNGRAAPGAGQFDAIDQMHPQGRGGTTRLFQAFEGVVVSQRQDSHAFFKRTRNQYRGRQGAVGGRAVAVQINIHGSV